MRRLAIPFLFALALGAHAQERAIVKEIVVKATPEVAFRTWTTSDGIKSFFAPDAHVEARPDGPFQIYINPYAQPGMKGADDMRFLAVQEPKFFSFTWNAPPSLPDARRQRTFVTVRLTPVSDTETRVVLHHSGWGEGGQWDQAYAYFDRAWGNVLANLKKRFEDGPVDWTDWLKRMREATPK